MSETIDRYIDMRVDEGKKYSRAEKYFQAQIKHIRGALDIIDGFLKEDEDQFESFNIGRLETIVKDLNKQTKLMLERIKVEK